jgi:hypothetical protein
MQSHQSSVDSAQFFGFALVQSELKIARSVGVCACLLAMRKVIVCHLGTAHSAAALLGDLLK